MSFFIRCCKSLLNVFFQYGIWYQVINFLSNSFRIKVWQEYLDPINCLLVADQQNVHCTVYSHLRLTSTKFEERISID
jgi:hypothetical protein